MSGCNGDYQAFLNRKSQLDSGDGFDPLWMPDFLFDFQKFLVDWSIRIGRGAEYADCGLGKTPMQLVWAENVVRKTNGRVLILTPLAVSHQTVHEGEKFGIECERSQTGAYNGSRIIVTNYQRLHYFKPDEFSGVVCDESSCLKDAKTETRGAVTEFLRTIPYRLLCTATAAPNDFFELGTSSEALGYLGFQDMLTRFFKEQTKKDFLGWGRKTYYLRGHSEEPFWRWVCSWARVCRKPSDLGFDDDGFILPPLIEHEHEVKTRKLRPGMLFALPAKDMREQRQERRITLRERCEEVAELVSGHDGSTVSWCHLNPEGDLLEKLIPDGLQVKGDMTDEEKEERLLAFQTGELKRLIIKPKIGAWGLNWPHCSFVTTYPSHSWEQYYQAVRRCWRFGQKNPVNVHVVTTEGEHAVVKNLQRKAGQADKMFNALVGYMDNAMHIERTKYGTTKTQVPSWLG